MEFVVRLDILLDYQYVLAQYDKFVELFLSFQIMDVCLAIRQRIDKLLEVDGNFP